MSIDKFFHRRYAPNYNCASFVIEVWKHLTGDDIGDELFLNIQTIERTPLVRVRKRFKLLSKPTKLCVVMMQGIQDAAHVGIVLNDRVFHIRRTRVEYQPIDVATIGYSRVRFYAP